MNDAGRPDEGFPQPPRDQNSGLPADRDCLDIDREIASLREQLRLDSDAGRLWERLGLLQRACKRPNLALRALETASLLVPLSHDSQMALAGCYVAAGFQESARAIYRHLASLIHLPTRLLSDLAAGLGRVGEHELALSVCRDAAQRMPGEAGPLLGIARHLRRLRRPPATILPYLIRAFEADPTNTACRISLAWMLHACGRSVAGAQLLDRVAVADVECVPSLTFMHRVFEAAEDRQCADICKYRLEALAAQRWRQRP